MSNAFIFDMPMKLGLELMAPVGSYCMDAERKLIDHIINELYGIILIVTRVDFHRPDPGGIVDCCVLKTPDSVAFIVPQPEKLDIHLDMMTWNFLRISSCVNSTSR